MRKHSTIIHILTLLLTITMLTGCGNMNTSTENSTVSTYRSSESINSSSQFDEADTEVSSAEETAQPLETSGSHPTKAETEEVTTDPAQTAPEAENATTLPAQTTPETNEATPRPAQTEAETACPTESEPETESFCPTVPESEPETSAPSVPETERETSAPSVPETEPETSAPSVPETEPETSAPSVPETEPETSAPSVPETEPETSAPDESDDFRLDLAKEAFDIMNGYRADVNLPALTWSDSLYASSQIRAKEIVTSFSHTRPDGTSCFTAFEDIWLGKGENILYGSGSTADTAAEAMTAWYNSQGHRENMLRESFNHAAVACYYENGTYYWVTLFGYK